MKPFTILISVTLSLCLGACKFSQEDSKSKGVEPSVSLPLKTQGRFIVDQNNRRVKLKSVNWYGASDDFHVNLGLHAKHRDEIAQDIVNMGFNSVRFPFSNEMLHHTEGVPKALVAANPKLAGLQPIIVMDAIIQSLSQRGLYIILNNHTTKGQWCCGNNDGDGLWFNDSYSEQRWIDDWKLLAQRYKSNPYVIGADLRNELRRDDNTGRTPNWGKGGALDWRLAAERAGNAVLAENPNLLIIVEGLEYSTNLKEVYHHPIRLNIANRLVYSVHSYHFFNNVKDANQSYQKTSEIWGDRWGYILAKDKPYTAPIWVSEIGIGIHENKLGDKGYLWWRQLMCYLQNTDIDFAYWAFNGQKLKSNLEENVESFNNIYQGESYGLLNSQWQAFDVDWRLKDLQSFLMPTREGPGLAGSSPYMGCSDHNP